MTFYRKECPTASWHLLHQLTLSSNGCCIKMAGTFLQSLKLSYKLAEQWLAVVVEVRSTFYFCITKTDNSELFSLVILEAKETRKLTDLPVHSPLKYTMLQNKRMWWCPILPPPPPPPLSQHFLTRKRTKPNYISGIFRRFWIKLNNCEIKKIC